MTSRSRRNGATTHNLPGGGLCLSTLFLALLSLSSAVYATDGLFLPGLSPIQWGRAGAGVASPRDSSWMCLNPGSITALNRRWDAGLTVLRSDVTLQPRGLLGNRRAGEMTDNEFFFIPSFGMVLPAAKGTWGLGVYVPSGIAVDYPESRNIISRLLQGNADRRLDYQHARLVGAYAVPVSAHWSLGAALNVSISRFRTDSLTLNLRPTDGEMKWDEALGAGLCFGAFGKWQRFSVGAAYHTRQWSESFEDYADLLAWSVDLPQTVQAGAAFKVSPSVELMLDYKFIDWDSVALAGRSPLDGGFGWQDQHIWKTALEWTPTERCALRCGLSHGSPLIPGETAFINGLTPLVARDHVAVGFTHAVSRSSEIHVSYVRGLRNNTRGSGRGDVFALLSGSTNLTLGHDSLTIGYSHAF